MTELARFLNECAGRRFELGVHDCGLWLAEWLECCRGIDVARDLRGRYRQPDELVALVGTANVLRIVGRFARRAGLARTPIPQPGDIGVISLAPAHAVGAIRSARGWTVIGSRGGVSCAPAARVLAAWKV